MYGTVSSWIERRGFGFVRPDGWNEDVFIHISDCPESHSLPVNARIEFAVIPYGKRSKCINIRVIPISDSGVQS